MQHDPLCVRNVSMNVPHKEIYLLCIFLYKFYVGEGVARTKSILCIFGKDDCIRGVKNEVRCFVRRIFLPVEGIMI